ncbi:hypothetical protein AX16_007049 [Volvariella volvacea WC 439]|nr:hypothetical protein AX16_007049 [Volvariella volvacea WC 439]
MATGPSIPPQTVGAACFFVMTATTLTNAPLDVILYTAEHLDLEALCTLRLVSRNLCNQISPITLRSITFRINEARTSMNRLYEVCSQPYLAYHKYTRRLTVKTNNTHIDRNIREDEMEVVYETIGRLQCLTSLDLQWESTYEIKGQAAADCLFTIQDRIVEAVYRATGGRLDRLAVEPALKSHGYGLPGRMLEFRGLRIMESKLGTMGQRCGGLDKSGERRFPYDENAPECCISPGYKEGLRAIVRNNPGLEVFAIRQGCVMDFYDVGELFGKEGKESALALRQLTVQGLRFPHTIPTHNSPFAHLEHLNVLFNSSLMPLDNLWKSLEATGTKLKTLTTHQLSLASYSGLQQLAIMQIDNTTREWTDSSAVTAFFNNLLPRHSSSLTKLSTLFRPGITHLDGWSFTPHVWKPALQVLSALNTLSMYSAEIDEPPYSVMRKWEETDESGRINEIETELQAERRVSQTSFVANVTRIYQEVIDHVEGLPRLQTLEIRWPDEVLWTVGTFRRRKWLICAMKSVVKRLRSCSGVPRELVLLSGVYGSRRVEDSGAGEEWEFFEIESEDFWSF